MGRGGSRPHGLDRGRAFISSHAHRPAVYPLADHTTSAAVRYAVVMLVADHTAWRTGAERVCGQRVALPLRSKQSPGAGPRRTNKRRTTWTETRSIFGFTEKQEIHNRRQRSRLSFFGGQSRVEEADTQRRSRGARRCTGALCRSARSRRHCVRQAVGGSGAPVGLVRSCLGSSSKAGAGRRQKALPGSHVEYGANPT